MQTFISHDLLGNPLMPHSAAKKDNHNVASLQSRFAAAHTLNNLKESLASSRHDAAGFRSQGASLYTLFLDKALHRACRSHLGEVRSVQSGVATSTPLPSVSLHAQSRDRLYSGVFTLLMVPSCLDLFSFKAAPLHPVQRQISATTPP